MVKCTTRNISHIPRILKRQHLLPLSNLFKLRIPMAGGGGGRGLVLSTQQVSE